jgi:hypothetical protein
MLTKTMPMPAFPLASSMLRRPVLRGTNGTRHDTVAYVPELPDEQLRALTLCAYAANARRRNCFEARVRRHLSVSADGALLQPFCFAASPSTRHHT